MRIDCVLDTSALVAYWREEPGCDVVGAALRDSGCAMHAVNVAEFLYSLPRRRPELFNISLASDWVERVGIVCMEGLDRRFRALCAAIRLAAPALSVGDGFAVALASVMDVPVVTSDKAFARARDFASVHLIR